MLRLLRFGSSHDESLTFAHNNSQCGQRRARSQVRENTGRKRRQFVAVEEPDEAVQETCIISAMLTTIRAEISIALGKPEVSIAFASFRA